MLIVASVEGTQSVESFQQIFIQNIAPYLRPHSLSAGSWADETTGAILVTVWTQDSDAASTSQRVTEALEKNGFRTVIQAFKPLAALASWLGLPDKSIASFCDLQYNTHGDVPERRLLKCPGGHAFDKRHEIRNCTICGQVLV